MKTICFRVDSSTSVGMGHLMECIALTEIFHRKHDVSIEFIINNFPPLKEILSKYNVKVLTLGKVENELRNCII